MKGMRSFSQVDEGNGDKGTCGGHRLKWAPLSHALV